jgi:hypothetical protein
MVQLKSIVATMVAGCVSVASASTYEHAIRLMEESPLIDSHIDLPQILRSLSKFSFGIQSWYYVRSLNGAHVLDLQAEIP